MRMAEVDQSGYLRAKRVGKLAYKDRIRRNFIDALLTSDPVTLQSGQGALFTLDLVTPDGYQFNAIYRVESSHPLACSIGSFRRNGVTDNCTVSITNHSGETFNDLTVTMGVRFVQLEAV